MVPIKNASCYRVLRGHVVFVSARALPSPHAHFVRSPLYFLHRMIAHCHSVPSHNFSTLGLWLAVCYTQDLKYVTIRLHGNCAHVARSRYPKFEAGFLGIFQLSSALGWLPRHFAIAIGISFSQRTIGM